MILPKAEQTFGGGMKVWFEENYRDIEEWIIDCENYHKCEKCPYSKECADIWNLIRKNFAKA